MPIAVTFSATSGLRIVATSSRFRRCTTSCVVPAGAKIPYQLRAVSISGYPMSRMVGTSGIAASRLGPITASALSLPARMCGRLVAESNMNSTCPPSSATIPGAMPLYATCVAEVPAASENNTPARCESDPAPADA